VIFRARACDINNDIAILRLRLLLHVLDWNGMLKPCFLEGKEAEKKNRCTNNGYNYDQRRIFIHGLRNSLRRCGTPVMQHSPAIIFPQK